MSGKHHLAAVCMTIIFAPIGLLKSSFAQVPPEQIEVFFPPNTLGIALGKAPKPHYESACLKLQKDWILLGQANTTSTSDGTVMTINQPYSRDEEVKRCTRGPVDPGFKNGDNRYLTKISLPVSMLNRMYVDRHPKIQGMSFGDITVSLQDGKLYITGKLDEQPFYQYCNSANLEREESNLKGLSLGLIRLFTSYADHCIYFIDYTVSLDDDLISIVIKSGHIEGQYIKLEGFAKGPLD
jgi:hypothetical protein